MQNKALKICGLTFILGIFGGFLRWVQLKKIIEPQTRLAVSGSPWSYAVIAYLIVCVAIIILLIHSLYSYKFPQTYPEVFSRGKAVYSVFAVIIGIIMVAGGAMTIVRSMTDKSSYSVFELLLGFLAVPTAACIASFIINANKTGKKMSGSFSAVFIVVYLCYWLIAAYKYSAADPVIWHFALRLLAVSAVILAFYYIAGFVYMRPKALSSLFFSLLSILLCTVTLADSYPIGEQLIVFSIDASLILLSCAQIGCMYSEANNEQNE